MEGYRKPPTRGGLLLQRPLDPPPPTSESTRRLAAGVVWASPRTLRRKYSCSYLQPYHLNRSANGKGGISLTVH